jgi:hypothetical protein
MVELTPNKIMFVLNRRKNLLNKAINISLLNFGKCFKAYLKKELRFYHYSKSRCMQQ